MTSGPCPKASIGAAHAKSPSRATLAGLPVGLQIVGPRFAEALVLRAAHAFEAARPFPHPHPLLKASIEAIAEDPDAVS